MSSNKTRKRKSLRKFQKGKSRKTKKNSNKYRTKKRKTKMRGGGMRTSRGAPTVLYGTRWSTNTPAGPGFAESRGLQESNLLQKFRGPTAKWGDDGERVLVERPGIGWTPGKITEIDDRSEGGETLYTVQFDDGERWGIRQTSDKNETFQEMMIIEPNPGDHPELGCMCPVDYPICGRAGWSLTGGWCMNNETNKTPTTEQGGCGGKGGESCKYSRDGWVEEYKKKIKKK